MTLHPVFRRLAPATLAVFLAMPLTPGSVGSLHAQPGTQQTMAQAEVNACQAWRDHLEHTVSLMDRTNSLAPGEASPLSLLVAAMGQRCAGTEPARVSRLFVLLLDLLTDQPNQP